MRSLTPAEGEGYLKTTIRDRKIAAVILGATGLMFFSDLAPMVDPLIAILLIGAALLSDSWATPAVRAQVKTVWPPATFPLVLVAIADSLGFIVVDRSTSERVLAIGLNVIALSCVVARAGICGSRSAETGRSRARSRSPTWRRASSCAGPNCSTDDTRVTSVG